MKYAEVQRQRKAVPFTVYDIGVGKAALDKWKSDQVQLELDYQARMAPERATRRATAIAMVNEGSTSRDLIKTETDALERDYIDGRPPITEKPCDCKEQSHQLCGHCLQRVLYQKTLITLAPENKRNPSISKRVKDWFLQVLSDSFGN